ncbi:hypothetical protein IFM89_014721 [Coptis chinensis]|uniref:Uncharacterized protein n=1 Tax=Coptis chinensis TaxID=261450 RepID=A0A835LLL2_9MAGN|nr:hypothetical protein IFM89_014721 [Coptis chinensis]
MKESPVAFRFTSSWRVGRSCVQRGLFRHDVTACETKVTTLRRGPPKFQVDKVLQPFDENKFNFTKVGQEEVLFQFEESDTDETQFFPSAPIDTEDSPNVVAINNQETHTSDWVTTAWVHLQQSITSISRGLVFESGNSIENLSIVVSDSSICLQENNIFYNVLIADSGKRIFLLPQSLAANLGISTGKKQNIVALSSTIVGGENP